MTKPVQQPNLLHQQILGDLLRNQQTTRIETRSKRDKWGAWVEHKVEVLVPMLAGGSDQGMSDQWPLWWRLWDWLRRQIVDDDPAPELSRLDRWDGRK